MIPRREVKAWLTAQELLAAVARAGLGWFETSAEWDELEAWLAERGYDWLNYIRARYVVKMRAVDGVRAGYRWDD